MSTQVLPSLIGMDIAINKEISFDTNVQISVSRKENRISYSPYPQYRWTLQYNLLRASPAFVELQSLTGFFNARQGKFDTFQYQDPDDNSASSQSLGIGNGATKAYQLVRNFGSFIEPILAPQTIAGVFLNAVSIPSAGYSAPAAPTLGSSTAGSLGATTYYVRVSWVTNSGETLAGTEASLATLVNKVLTVTQPASPPAGAISWNVYVSNTAGSGSGHETLQATVAIGTTTWTEPTTGLVAGVALPASNTTGWSVSVWGSATPGVITFQGNVVNSIVVTATFSFYWPVRMDDDKLGLNRFVSQWYEAKKFTFISVFN